MSKILSVPKASIFGRFTFWSITKIFYRKRGETFKNWHLELMGWMAYCLSPWLREFQTFRPLVFGVLRNKISAYFQKKEKNWSEIENKRASQKLILVENCYFQVNEALLQARNISLWFLIFDGLLVR